MKRILSLAAVLTLSAAVSCTKQNTETYVAPTITTEVSANVPCPLTKTYLEDHDGISKYQVYWRSGDKINVNGKDSEALTTESGKSSAKFTFTSELEIPYKATYPASAYSDGHINLPRIQTYTEGTFNPLTAIMLGYSEDGSVINFSHAVAYLKLKITGLPDGIKVKTISVGGPDGTQMSGRFDIQNWDSTPSLVSTSSAAYDNAVTVDCGEGVGNGTSVFVAIPETDSYKLRITAFLTNGKYKYLVSDNGYGHLHPGYVFPIEMDLSNAREYTAFNGDKLYLADVDSEASLKSFLMGCPTVMNKVGDYTYKLLYYSKSADTELRFTKAKTLAGSVYGLSVMDESVWSFAADAVKGYKIGKTGYVYVTFNTNTLSCTVEQVNPTSSACSEYDWYSWNVSANNIDISIAARNLPGVGWATNNDIHFIKDTTNPFVMTCDFTINDEAGANMHFIPVYYHANGTWDYWYGLDEALEKAYPQGTEPDSWIYCNKGKYRIEFDYLNLRIKLYGI